MEDFVLGSFPPGDLPIVVVWAMDTTNEERALPAIGKRTCLSSMGDCLELTLIHSLLMSVGSPRMNASAVI